MDEGALRLALGVWVVVFGAVVGSFLNVVIARVPEGESVAWPGSRCPGCRSPIAWYDNVPVVSWLVLRGRCRRCGMAISIRYVLVELAGAAAAWLAWTRHGLSLAGAAELALVDLLVVLALIDLATWLLPNVLTWLLVVLGVAAAAAGAAPADGLRAAALGALVGFGAFAAVWAAGWLLLRKEALGFGDVWLLAGCGAWFGVPALLPIVLLASIQGSVYGLSLIALGRSEPGPPPPGEAPTPDATAAPIPDAAAASIPDAASPPAPTPDAAASPAPPPAGSATAEGEEPWVPPRHAVPFGPFLVAGALEWLYLRDVLAAVFPALGVFR